MKRTNEENPCSTRVDGALYMDNAATSWPKPPEVAKAMVHFLDQVGANPGRSGHRMSIEAARIVYNTREAIAKLFHAPDPLRVFFGINVTDGINLALHGLLKPGDHVITSSMEHNSVMRPLLDLASSGVEFTRLKCGADGTLDPALIEPAVQSRTRLIVLNHASNVCGTILPIHEAGLIARRHSILFLVDTAQTAGVIPLDMVQDNIDLLAFTGHKSLYGPMGTGGLIAGDRIAPHDLKPIRQGGTGSRSENELQPDFFPDQCESGTPNAVGLAGLSASLKWILTRGIETIHAHERELCGMLIEGLTGIPGVTVYGTHNPDRQTATVAFTIDGLEPSEVGLRLDDNFGILCRVGLHCAPSAHQTLGTFPTGCVRFGLGAFTEAYDVQRAIKAVDELAKGAKRL